MEDFSNILWLLILAGSAAVSIAAKTKENKRKAASGTVPQPKVPESARPDKEADAEFRPDSGKGCDVSVTGPVAADETYAQTASTKAPSHEPPHDSSAKQPENCAESGILSDFDLRKAVIWSEILKPKYDED